MIKTILVAASGDAADEAAFAAALAVARPFAAHIDALHVRQDPAAIAVAMTTESGAGALTPGLFEQLERDGRERETRAQARFVRLFGQGGAPGGQAFAAEWHVEVGGEARWMVAYGVAADLVVAPRAAGEVETPRAVLEAVLLETGRPLLIPGSEPFPAAIDRVAIAWKPTPQAARAVASAMPFLARAKEAVVLTVDDGGAEDDGADRLLRNLGRRGLTARYERVAPGPEGAAASLVAAAAARAELLVMGGYGHSRVREWVFGGFTQHVLAAAPLPVLIAH